MFRWHSAFGGSHWGRFRLELFGTMEPMEPGASQKKVPSVIQSSTVEKLLLWLLVAGHILIKHGETLDAFP